MRSSTWLIDYCVPGNVDDSTVQGQLLAYTALIENAMNYRRDHPEIDALLRKQTDYEANFTVTQLAVEPSPDTRI